MTTKIVHCKEKYDIYIGRKSKWGNPFIIGKDGSRNEVIEKYEIYLNSRPDLLIALNEGELKNSVLGCYCKPLACHGDILVKYSSSKWITNWFSNMLPLDKPFIYQGITYYSAENFYQAMKLPKNRIDLRSKIASMSPQQAKIKIRNKKEFLWSDDWSPKKADEVMWYILI